MGKPTGFLEYKRLLRKDSPVKERIKNWDEFHYPITEEEIKIQSARCMDCGVPFCHMGLFLNNVAAGCPLHNLIPEWNDLIYKGRFKEAFTRLIKTNNFPEFTGRVCPALCEGSCTEGLNKEPVFVKGIEEFIINLAYEKGWLKANPPKTRTGKKVAVVGSGPSGLAAADELNKLGHLVTVYERADRIGGLLMYGIPNMKLDKKLVQRRINLMAEEGINFVPKKEIGKDIKAAELLNNFDAVVLCCGSTKPRDLEVEGRNLNGVHFAMDFLTNNTKCLLNNNFDDPNFISAKDKHVVIIGGGDTGTDCVATSIRHGAKSVTQLEILPQPPVTRADNNPWPEWPKTLKVDYGQEEAIELFGNDPREYCQMTKKITGAKNQVTAIETVEITWEKDNQNRFVPIEIPNTLKARPADLILLAMGFTGAEENILKDFDLNLNRPILTAKLKATDFSTNKSKIFVAGDMRRGQSLVVWAIHEGRLAAQVCNEFLEKPTKK
ncbi:MAG: glutamate synthase subunit beta [Candidatus Margulisiibacteriota bacterium]